VTMQRLTFNLSAVGPIRHEMLEGRDHLVVPTVMIVEGVLNGSNGRLYYPGDELEKSPQVWNHRPLVVYHPKGGTACDPAVLNTRKIGVILNTSYTAPKLRTESWIDVAAANRVDRRVIESLESNQTVEVSTGLYTDNEMTSGEYNGKAYDAIARNYRPDHLAILPDLIGACSIKDGAGLLQLNEQGKLTLDRIGTAAVMGQLGLRPMLTENERSYGDITSELYSLLYARFGWDCYIDAVFDGYFVYCFDGKTYKLTYTATDKEVTMTTDPVEVYRTVNYVTANGAGSIQTVTNALPASIPQKEFTVAKSEFIASLIANGGYEESDRPMLEGLAEDKLGKLAGKLTANAATPPAQPAQPAAPPVLIPAQPALNLDQYVAQAPAPIREILQQGLQANSRRKAELVGIITNTPGCRFSADHLNTQSLDQLEGIASLCQPAAPVANYAGAWTPAANGMAVNASKMPEEDETPYEMPTMNFDDRKVNA